MIRFDKVCPRYVVRLCVALLECQETFKASVNLTRGFHHLRSLCGLVMARLQVVEGDTIEDIDEALGYLSEQLRKHINRETFLAICDDLLDERLKQCESL